jgi:hypothetical protein
VNGVDIGSIVDYQALPLDPTIEAFQEAYIRHVVDTVHDLPNVRTRSPTSRRACPPTS